MKKNISIFISLLAITYIAVIVFILFMPLNLPENLLKINRYSDIEKILGQSTYNINEKGLIIWEKNYFFFSHSTVLIRSMIRENNDFVDYNISISRQVTLFNLKIVGKGRLYQIKSNQIDKISTDYFLAPFGKF